ncbi:MAG: DNA adenine methylase [Chloroflexota bacterium]
MSSSRVLSAGRRQRRPDVLLSPLRYPGGKRRLAPYVAEALRLNGLRPRLYVEPFAGGASVAIQLLHENLVEQVVLGEKDPMVAGFWKAVFTDHEQLIARLQKLKPTLENWEYYRSMRPRTVLGWAVKCLFLNRTSFSGILSPTAGPIGGRSQASEHRIDCRFPVERLANRIRQIAAFADRVLLVHEGDWRDLIEHVQKLGYERDQVFYYLDPPFYEKADRLYRYYFHERDHQELHDTLGKLGGNYILSYDAAEPIVRRYSAHANGTRHVELLYSATRRGELIKARELIVSNLPRLPEHTRLWRSKREAVSHALRAPDESVAAMEAVALDGREALFLPAALADAQVSPASLDVR